MTNLINGIGVLGINLLLLEQADRLQKEKMERKTGDYLVYELIAFVLMTGFMQFLIENNYSVLWILPVDAAVLFLFGRAAGHLRAFTAVKRALLVCTTLFVSMIFNQKLNIIISSYNELLKLLVIYFIFSYGLLVMLQKSRKVLSRKETVILSAAGLLSLVEIYLLLWILEGDFYKEFIYGVLLCVLGIDGILFYLVIKLKEGHAKEQQYTELEQQYVFQQQYMQSICELDEQARRIRHDLKHHISSLNTMLNQDNPNMKEIRAYLSQYAGQTMLLQESVQTNNAVVNAVINAKLTYCMEHHIRTAVSVDQKIKAIPAVDLCSLLGNILDNAIEAEEKLEKDSRAIEIRIQSDGVGMDILVKNNIKQSVLEQNQELKTTKEDHRHHGLGSKIVKTIVHKYSGYIDYYEEQGSFCCHIQL